MNYERINWENGTQVQGAYVEINGTRYPVVMPTYDTDTPITAENLNIMDKGIYDAKNSINTNTNNIVQIQNTVNGLIDSKVINELFPNRTGGSISIIRHPFTLYTPLNLKRVGNLVHITGDLKVILEHTGAEPGWWAFCDLGTGWKPIKETIFNCPVSKDNEEITLRIDTDGIMSYYIFNTSRYPLSLNLYVRVNVTYLVN